MVYMHSCAILPKNCRVAPSPLRHVASLIPPGRGILIHSTRTSHIRIRSTFHLLWISHIWIRSTFYLIRMSHSRHSIGPTSHFLRMSHSRNSIRPKFHLLRIFSFVVFLFILIFFYFLFLFVPTRF